MAVLWYLLPLVANSVAAITVARDNRINNASLIATVDFSNNTGPAEQLCSGFIGGIPFEPNQIPSHFYTDMGFRAGRGSGKQTGGGWTESVSAYEEQFAATLSAYRTARQYNATFTVGPGAMWGLNVSTPKLTPHPGADGDWSEYDAFLDRVIRDLKINYATEGLYFEIWNEPEYPAFWTAGLDHYLDLWGRSYHRVRSQMPELKIIGPTYSNWTGNWVYPTNITGYEGDWWNKWAAFVKANNSVPDEYVWHMENNRTGGTMLTANGFFQDLLRKYDLPQRPLNINEYAVQYEQSPAGTSWWIAQLERMNAVSLRGNWGSPDYFDDGFAWLLWKPNYTNPTGKGYYPNGEYQVYKYYNQHMNGWRAGSLPSNDSLFDTHAVVGHDNVVRLLAGGRNESGTWELELKNLEKLGLPSTGVLDVKKLEFPFPSRMAPVYDWKDLGTTKVAYSGGTASWLYSQADNVTAYAYEFCIPGAG